ARGVLFLGCAAVEEPAPPHSSRRGAAHYFDVAPRADRTLPVARDTPLPGLNVFFAHQSHRQGAGAKLKRYVRIATHLGLIHEESYAVRTRVIGNLVVMPLARLRQTANFLEQTKILGSARWRRIGHAREGKLAIDRRDDLVADKEIQRSAGRKIQHVEGYEAVVEILRTTTNYGCRQIEGE